jgi:uncharacterized protein YbaR (Trm112 family)
VFIELTDHLRCPVEHEEQFLVLIPHAMDGRAVLTGRLGCPACRREFTVADGIADLRLPDDPPLPVAGSQARGVADPAAGAEPLSADGTLALLGLGGPGGYVALVGDAAGVAPGLMAAMPGVHFVAVNVENPLDPAPMLSRLVAGRLPFKRRSLRGVVLGPGYGGEARWTAEALRTILPGLRVVGAGAAPEGLTVLGEAGGWYVGTA